jgi:hypothetical protein
MLRRRRRKAAQLAKMLVQLERSVARPPRRRPTRVSMRGI